MTKEEFTAELMKERGIKTDQQEKDIRDYVANQCCKSRHTRMKRKGR